MGQLERDQARIEVEQAKVAELARHSAAMASYQKMLDALDTPSGFDDFLAAMADAANDQHEQALIAVVISSRAP